MTGAEPVLLDTDTLSELSRGNARVCEQALAYLSRFDESAAGVAGEIWSRVSANRRCQLRDILIAAIAMSRQLPLVTRNRRDFEELGLSSGAPLRLLDWSAKG